MIRPLLVAALALGLAGPAFAAKKKPAPPPVTPAPVVAAEKAFAVDGVAMGVKQSFLKHMADDAIVFQPDPMNAREAISKQSDAPGPKLEWWPTWAGIAQSGDLGFTTGPYAVDGVRRGHYFTVWMRQADGAWKWVYDGGTSSSAATAPGPERPTAYLPVSDQPVQDPKAAYEDMQAAEVSLNTAAKSDLAAGYLAVMVCEGRIQGSSAAPAQGCASFRTELATRGRKADFQARSGAVSGAGDLGWTWGDASWTDMGEARRGHYVRVWQKRADGWRLVFDQLLTSPPKVATKAPPAPAAAPAPAPAAEIDAEPTPAEEPEG
jgi:ketosteroid isomerase-like protein